MIGLPLRRLAPWLLLWVAVFVQAAPEPDKYSLTIEPAWEGHVKPGFSSELGIRLLAPHGGHALLKVLGSRAHVSAESRFEPATPVLIYLPLVHESVDPVTVELHIDEQLVLRKELELKVMPRASEIVAVVTLGEHAQLPPPTVRNTGTTVLYPTADNLPREGGAYDILSALWLSESALRTLDRQQRQALSEYISACGVVYLSGVSATESQLLRDAAGCGGRKLMVWQSGQMEIPQSVDINPLPGVASLRQLVPDGRTAVLNPLLVFLLAYVMLLLLMARSVTSALTLLAVPPVATALALLGWSLGQPVNRVAVWAEMDSGDPVARYVGLLQVVGTTHGMNTLALNERLGVPMAEPADQVAQVHFDPMANRVDLNLDTRLLSRHEFSFEGVAVGPAIELRHHGGGVHVVNRGGVASESGILAWQGHRYSIPGLAVGQEWQQPEQAEPWSNTPEEQLLRQRASTGGSWILMPFHLPDLQVLTTGEGAAGWLLIRGGSDA